MSTGIRLGASGSLRTQPAPRGRRAWIALAAIGLVAFVVRLAPVVAGGGVLGIHDYDDGVYFASAIAFVHGVLPYRDFLLLHPPGIVLALAPFASLGTAIGDPDAFAVARLAMMTLGAVNAVLVAVIAGRYGRFAGLTAGVLYAVWSAASNGERSTDLHAVQTTLVLVALLVLARRGRVTPARGAMAGAFLGLAIGVQLWQAVTLLVVAWWVAVRARDHGWARLWVAGATIGAAAATFTIVIAPFLLADSASVVRYVVLDQMGRPENGASLIERIRVLEGFPRLVQLPAAVRPLLADPLVVSSAIVALAVAVMTAWRLVWTRPWAALMAIEMTVVLRMPSFVNDYASLVAPAASLTLGTGLAALAVTAVRRGASPRLAGAGLVLVLGAAMFVSVARREGDAVPLAAIERDLQSARCVASDTPTLSVLTSSMRRNLTAGCPIVVDPTGVAYDHQRPLAEDPAPGSWRLTVPGYQEAMADWYGNADAALFARMAQNGLTDETKATIGSRLPVLRNRGVVTVYLRGSD